MKKIIVLMLAILLIPDRSATAQSVITVQAVTKEMSRGMQPGFMVNIPEAKLAAVKSAYEKQLEANTKANAKEINAELVNYGVVNKNVSTLPFIVYAKIIETIEGVELTAFVTQDSLNFISETSNPDQAAAIKKSLHDFSVTEYRKVATAQLDVENKKLAELKSKLNSQLKSESGNTKDISKKQREIDSYKSKIEDTKSLQSAKTTQISNQQKMIDGFSDRKSPEYELAVKNKKKYESEKKDLVKDEEKLNRNIDDNNDEIKSLQDENEALKKEQETSKQEITAQEAVVKASQDKLNGIK